MSTAELNTQSGSRWERPSIPVDLLGDAVVASTVPRRHLRRTKTSSSTQFARRWEPLTDLPVNLAELDGAWKGVQQTLGAPEKIWLVFRSKTASSGSLLSELSETTVGETLIQKFAELCQFLNRETPHTSRLASEGVSDFVPMEPKRIRFAKAKIVSRSHAQPNPILD